MGKHDDFIRIRYLIFKIHKPSGNEREELFQCGGYLDMQIGMESLYTEWAKEEPKMGQIIRYIYVIANNSIFKSIVKYFVINSAEGILKNSFYRFKNIVRNANVMVKPL